ncbi:MAG: winged helix-turn-helix domain-containing protein [Rickettsia slovaca]|uniref:Transcriptional regulator n=2 Tax=spotted fever group TaxID=114277 RepID=Q7PAG9_RICS2|nr:MULTISPECIES: winged helix-turn-helix domain-containing protein [spotted fever group]AEV91742.1 Response regulator [Rickettsia slovaca 13-B]EAA25868.1 putative transcriptional regulator [Rickettsia sibirica 246]
MRRFKSVVQDNIIKFKNLNIDLNTEKVYKDGLNIPLGPTEFKILQLFFQVPNEVFLRQEIIKYLWESEETFNERLIDVHINRIREVLGKDNLIITTVRLSVIV